MSSAARVISVLMRSDSEALPYFGVRTRAAKKPTIEELTWWRDFLTDVVAQSLLTGDTDQLGHLQQAITSAMKEQKLAQTLSSPTSEVVVDVKPSAGNSSEFAPPSPLPSNMPKVQHASPWIERSSTSDESAAESDEGARTNLLEPAEVEEALLKHTPPFFGRRDPSPAASEQEPHVDIGKTAVLAPLTDAETKAVPFKSSRPLTALIDPAEVAAAIDHADEETLDD